MTQFILLSLLLAATIQLPLVSVTDVWLREGTNITFKFPQGCNTVSCCKGDWCASALGNPSLPRATLTRCALTIYNLMLNDSRFTKCYSLKTSSTLHLNLSVATGCIWWDLHNVAFLGGRPQGQDKCTETIGDCRRLCTGVRDCQYFTFNKGNKKCSLIQSRDNLKIEFKRQYVSGYIPRDGCTDMNDDVVHLQYHQEAKSWIDALEYCQDRNSSLVEICSEAVQRAVKDLLQNETSSMQDGVWIGLERSIFGREDDPWKWISGSEVEDQTQWNSSHPVDRFNNHCGKIIWVKELQELKWLDACCHEKLPFICRADLASRQ